jgi:hypothetical protein
MLPVQPLLELLAKRRAHDAAVDLGTARSRVFAHAEGSWPTSRPWYACDETRSRSWCESARWHPGRGG